MGDQNPEEVLFNIDEENLRVLSEMYRGSEANPYASSLINNGLRIKEIMKNYPIRFVSPLSLWRDNGTFLAIMEFESCIEVGIFSLTPDQEDTLKDAVFSALTFTKKINFEGKRPIIFKEIHSGLHGVIEKIVKKKKLHVDRDDLFNVYKINRNQAIQTENVIPEDVMLKPLDATHAFVIKGNWPHYYPTADDIPCTLIDLNGGYGIFRRSDGVLLSWGIKTMMGQIGFVQTNKTCLRKGYGTMIVRTLAKELASEGTHPVAIVRIDDEGSQRFFEKLGFVNVGVCHNVHLKVRKPSDGGGTSKNK